MPPIFPALCAFAVCALLALPAIAQNNTSTPAPQRVAAPAPLPYTSALQGYQPFSDEKTRSWKESNATVEKTGGWRAYAKEAAEPEAKGSQTPATSPAAAPKAPAASADPHAGHGKH